jgi:hypothetical protein
MCLLGGFVCAAGGMIDINTFSGLMSLWKKPWAWICCNADTTCQLSLAPGIRHRIQYDLNGSGFKRSIFSCLEELVKINLH